MLPSYLAEFDTRLDNIVAGCFRGEPPLVLYHYTEWEGVEGILKSKQFRFTAHDCTNDPAELKSADDIVMKAAEELRSFVEAPGRSLLKLLLEGYSRLHVTNIASTYIACFSESRDSLAQWQAYGDAGSGVCLGVRVLKESLPRHDSVNRILIKVDYSEVSLHRKITDAFAAVCDATHDLAERQQGLPRAAEEFALNALYRIGAHAAIAAKQPSWSSEREWRQVAVGRRGVNVQDIESSARPGSRRYLQLFVRADERPLALSEIIVGPNQDFGAATDRLAQILSDAGYPDESGALPLIVASQHPTLQA